MTRRDSCQCANRCTAEWKLQIVAKLTRYPSSDIRESSWPRGVLRRWPESLRKPDGTASSVVTVDRTSPTGLSGESASKDGKPYYDWKIERNANGKPVSDALRFADGSFDERQKKPDGTTVEREYWAPTKTYTYQTMDANGRVVEVISDSQGYYWRATFRYDQGGRQTQVANYDRSGKLLRKDITKYEDDGNGNWIEEREYNWDAALGNKHPKLGAVNRRTITYY